MRSRKQITDNLKAINDGPAHGPGEHDQAMKETIIELLLDIRDKVCGTGEESKAPVEAQSKPRYSYCSHCGQQIEVEHGRYITHATKVGATLCSNSGRPA